MITHYWIENELFRSLLSWGKMAGQQHQEEFLLKWNDHHASFFNIVEVWLIVGPSLRI